MKRLLFLALGLCFVATIAAEAQFGYEYPEAGSPRWRAENLVIADQGAQTLIDSLVAPDGYRISCLWVSAYGASTDTLRVGWVREADSCAAYDVSDACDSLDFVGRGNTSFTFAPFPFECEKVYFSAWVGGEFMIWATAVPHPGGGVSGESWD